MASSELRFDGKVAVVTGAGGGLGRAYALLLGSRGAKVVVNDLGGSVDGKGNSSNAADKVVEEIKTKYNGEAIGNYDSVEFGDKIIKTAIETFGRIDILINNAGILRDRSFMKMSQQDWDLIYKVHMVGTYSTCKAAWPHMREQGYGRIVNVSSASGLYGNIGQSNYAAMKMGILGLSQTLSKEGNKYNIKVNTIAPIAGSRMTENLMPPDLLAALKPVYVAPIVAYLSHEDCEENGSIFELGAGWVAKLRWQRSKGCFFDLSGENKLTVESVAENFDEITEFNDDDVTYPTSSQDAFGEIMSNIERSPPPLDDYDQEIDNSSDSNSNQISYDIKSAPLFESMIASLESEGPNLVKKIKAIFRFIVDDKAYFVLDLKNGNGGMTVGDKDTKVDVTITISDDDFVSIVTGKLNPQSAFMKGKLKIKGNMALAMKLDPIIKLARRKRSKL